MGGGNLEAVDRVVKIVREPDGYRGFAAIGQPARAERGRLAAAAPLPLALAAPDRPWKEMAPQLIDMSRLAEGNGGSLPLSARRRPQAAFAPARRLRSAAAPRTRSWMKRSFSTTAGAMMNG